jgi:hypothetical protein
MERRRQQRLEISAQRLRALQATAAAGHDEMADALAARPAPAGLDRRGETDQIVRRVLRWGEQLGAVRIR